MRLLFLTNFYPPADRGGWEQWAQEIAEGFRARGHDVQVLTSRYNADAITDDPEHVHRDLYLDADLLHYRPLDFLLRQRDHDDHNFRTLDNLMRSFDPEAVIVWGMWNLNPQLAVRAEERLPRRVGYYFCGFWPVAALEKNPHAAFWEAPEGNALTNAIKKPAASVILARLQRDRSRQPALAHAACVSRFVCDTLRDGGCDTTNWRVIYGGVDLERFAIRREPLQLASRGDQDGRPLRLLFAGSLSREKGTDTCVEAAAILAKQRSPEDFHLTLVGTGHPAMEEQLHRTVADRSLSEYVTFQGRVRKEAMPDVLAGHDVLLFSSVWGEPLARMTMEGLASGLVVVSTTTGGTGEILEDGVNALTIEAGNASGLARQIERLLTEPGLAERIRNGGQQTARERLDLRRMTDEIEAWIAEVAQ